MLGIESHFSLSSIWPGLTFQHFKKNSPCANWLLKNGGLSYFQHLPEHTVLAYTTHRRKTGGYWIHVYTSKNARMIYTLSSECGRKQKTNANENCSYQAVSPESIKKYAGSRCSRERLAIWICLTHLRVSLLRWIYYHTAERCSTLKICTRHSCCTDYLNSSLFMYGQP